MGVSKEVLNYMPNADMPILVVDDAKFSSAIIAKALRSGGFEDVRFTNNPLQALRSLEKRPARILICDWLMPSMDGVELTRRLRELEQGGDHRTWVILLTNREELPSIQAALDADMARLSGGEASRVSLVRALQLEPTVLLLDEPAAALDPEAAEKTERLLDAWRRQGTRALIWVSHAPERVARLADQVIRVEPPRG